MANLTIFDSPQYKVTFYDEYYSCSLRLYLIGLNQIQLKIFM